MMGDVNNERRDFAQLLAVQRRTETHTDELAINT
jgi:hypothetical protein